MKQVITNILLVSIILVAMESNSQVGINTITPDSSAILDLYSNSKGFLMPRMTTAEKNLINDPATGLMIYDVAMNSVQVNTGTPSSPIWMAFQVNPSDTSVMETSILSISATDSLTTTSTADTIIPGMTLTPGAGTYLVFFNGQFGLSGGTPITTGQGVEDLAAAYAELMAISPTNTNHAAVFGNGETLGPGVYTTPAAASLAATLTLDGGGDSTSLFIFRINGALTTGAGTTVVLTNGASANNIFWIAEGALGLAANTIMKGTLISNNAAVSAAAGSNLDGRMFSTAGAISFGPGTATVPSGVSYVDLGVLSTFVMFTTAGAVGNTDPSMITGDVGSHLGAITGFENLNGNIYTPGSAPEPMTGTVHFRVYQNNVLVANSDRTSSTPGIINLQAMATVAAGQSIEIRWNIDEGSALIGNRILTLVDAQ